MSSFSDFFENLYEDIRDFFGNVFESTADVLTAFTKYFMANVDDMLIDAAKVGVAAANETSGKWSDKLIAAVEAAMEALGESAAEYSTTAIINAVQSVYTATKVTDDTEDTDETDTEADAS